MQYINQTKTHALVIVTKYIRHFRKQFIFRLVIIEIYKQ